MKLFKCKFCGFVWDFQLNQCPGCKQHQSMQPKQKEQETEG